jgi:hypothetical protein
MQYTASHRGLRMALLALQCLEDLLELPYRARVVGDVGSGCRLDTCVVRVDGLKERPITVSRSLPQVLQYLGWRAVHTFTRIEEPMEF